MRLLEYVTAVDTALGFVVGAVVALSALYRGHESMADTTFVVVSWLFIVGSAIIRAVEARR